MRFKLTTSILQATNASEALKDRFAKQFGEIIITQTNLDMVVDTFYDFDWQWAADTFLSATQYYKFTKTTSPARDKFKMVHASALTALEAHDKVHYSTFATKSQEIKDAHPKAHLPQLEVYDKIRTVELDNYHNDLATVLATYTTAMKPHYDAFYSVTRPAAIEHFQFKLYNGGITWLRSKHCKVMILAWAQP